jgi:hypothetical protein
MSWSLHGRRTVRGNVCGAPHTMTATALMLCKCRQRKQEHCCQSSNYPFHAALLKDQI